MTRCAWVWMAAANITLARYKILYFRRLKDGSDEENLRVELKTSGGIYLEQVAIFNTSRDDYTEEHMLVELKPIDQSYPESDAILGTVQDDYRDGKCAPRGRRVANFSLR